MTLTADKEDELARALPGAEDAMDTTETESSGKVSYEEVNILKGMLRLEDEQFSDEEEQESVPVPKKRVHSAKGATETKGDSSWKAKWKRAEDEVKAPPKKKKMKTAGGEQADFTESSAGLRGKKKKVVALKKDVASIGDALSKIAGPSGSAP